MKGFSPFGFLPDILSGKDPKQALEDGLKTAAITAAVVGSGGTAAPAAAPAMGATNAALIDSAVGTAGYGASSASAGASTGAGLLGSFKQFAGDMKPYGEAAQSAMQVKGLLDNPSQPVQGHAPPGMDGQGAQTLAQLAQQSGQMTPEMQARLQRRTMWG
jgi:hypothetical protein